MKAGAVLQMCSYVEQLERIQGVLPEKMYVALGGSAHETVALRVNDYLAYYRASKARFEEAVLGADAPAPTYPPAATYPEPVEHCDVCRWAEICSARRRDDDHLSLVAGISARQRKELTARGIDTVEALGRAPLPFEPPLDGLNPASVERVREQARIQVAGSGLIWPIHELFLPPAGRTDRAGARPGRASRSRAPATSSSTSRGTPTRSTTGSSTCSACWTRPAPSPPSGPSTPSTRPR